MEHMFGIYMGRKVHDVCKEAMERPMRLLEIFEHAGSVAESEERFLSWTVPVNNFPVIQNYTNGLVKKTWVCLGLPAGHKGSTGHYPNELQIMVSFPEEPQFAKGKQSQGASPNIIHSLDAAHLMMTVCKADFPVTTIHDSFGCLAADMPKLFTLLRETFLELYSTDPLASIFKDISEELEQVEKGNLDLKSILDSEYCFS